MPAISVIIITKNEANNIGDCLASVAWADEIVVADSGSTDNTIEICQSYDVKLSITEDWLGFGVQKNRALALASNEWVLSIDADERVSEQLRDEIQDTINTAVKDTAFQLPRSSSFCGQFIRHSGWSPDYVTRLFRRSEAKFSDDLVHEKIIHQGSLKQLKHPLIHYSYESLDDVLNKLNRYSSDGATMLYQKGRKASLAMVILRGFWAFIRTYIIRLGFLDGRMGFILAVYNAQTTYYKYLKLIMLNKQDDSTIS